MKKHDKNKKIISDFEEKEQSSIFFLFHDFFFNFGDFVATEVTKFAVKCKFYTHTL